MTTTIGDDPDTHRLLFARDAYLARLWNELQEAKLTGVVTDNPHLDEQRREGWKKREKIIEISLGYLKWKQRKWLSGGVTALKSMDAGEQRRQRQEGSLFCNLISEKLQLDSEVVSMDSGPNQMKGWSRDQIFLKRMRSIYPARNNKRGELMEMPEAIGSRVDKKRLTKPRHRWLKKQAAGDQPVSHDEDMPAEMVQSDMDGPTSNHNG